MSGYDISLTHQDVFAVLQPWIMAVTGYPSNCVIQGLGNRVPYPVAVPGFVVMTAAGFNNLRTPIETWDTSNPAPTTLASESGTKLRVQLDFISGPGVNPGAGDMAKLISGIWRTEATCTALGGGNTPPTCQPLYADEAIMAPLTDEEDQYEQRWTLTAYIQYNPVTTVPQQFADEANVTLVNVDEKYPP